MFVCICFCFFCVAVFYTVLRFLLKLRTCPSSRGRNFFLQFQQLQLSESDHWLDKKSWLSELQCLICAFNSYLMHCIPSLSVSLLKIILLRPTCVQLKCAPSKILSPPSPYTLLTSFSESSGFTFPCLTADKLLIDF